MLLNRGTSIRICLPSSVAPSGSSGAFALGAAGAGGAPPSGCASRMGSSAVPSGDGGAPPSGSAPGSGGALASGAGGADVSAKNESIASPIVGDGSVTAVSPAGVIQYLRIKKVVI